MASTAATPSLAGQKNMQQCAHTKKSASPAVVAKRRKAKIKQEAEEQSSSSIAGALRKLLVEYQLGISLNLILLLALTHTLFPALRAHTAAFFTLSYPSSTTTTTEGGGGERLYAQGPRDAYIVGSFVIVFTALRAFLLDYVFMPLAGACGIARPKQRVRFAEQAYVLFYYAFYWAWGVRLFIQGTPPGGWQSVETLLVSLWHDFPRVLLPGAVKLYYLSQLAQWIQMVIVIHIEQRRKDHWQMFTHHLVTIALMVGSYGARHTRVGIAILVCMDFVDCIFPLAKILRYLSLQTACDVAFGVFVLAWILSRHVAYLAICWSIHAHLGVEKYHPRQIGTFSTRTGEWLTPLSDGKILPHILQPLTDPHAETFVFNHNMRRAFLGLLMVLQCITLAWLVMIMRVVARVLAGQGADDSRSDDEEEEEGEEEEVDDIEESGAEPEKPRFIEVTTDSEEVSWPSSSARKGMSRKKSKGISSGLNLGEHKDFLNRIGCLSEEQLAREREKRESSPRVIDRR